MRAADLVRGILKEAGTLVRRSRMTRALDKALGPKLSAHCHIAGFRRGRLIVEVDQGPLFAELSGFRKDQIREAMNDGLDQEKIARIDFRMGGTGHV